MTATTKVLLYGSGLFGSNNISFNEALMDKIVNSYFNALVLWTLHIDSDGSLVYNDTVIVKDGVFSNTFNYLAKILNKLIGSKNLKGEYFKVYFCIGSGGVSDYTRLQSFLSTSTGKLTLVRNFSALNSALPISGYDLDDEDLIDATVISDVAMLVSGKKLAVTFCPYDNESVWNDALVNIYNQDLTNNPPLPLTISWYNLQCYSGGADNSPLAWLQALPSSVPISNNFIVPGYDASVMTPSEVSLAVVHNGVPGGFIWDSSNILENPFGLNDNNLFLSYSEALIAGSS